MANNSGKGGNIVENHAFVEKEDADKLLAACIKTEIKPIPSSRCCIYRVPKRLRKGVKNVAFLPEIVSIGPFHHGKESLKDMEEHKKWYLHAILSRTSTSLEDLVKTIRELEGHARDCYAEPIKNLNSDKFVKMMLLDGCFILEFLYIIAGEVCKNVNDPIYNSRWMIDSLAHDMMLLENQIPFVVVEHLFNLTRDPEGGRCSPDQLVIRFLERIIPSIGSVRSNFSRGRHLLDILHKNLLPNKLMEVGNYPVSEFRHCATDLEEAGVNFKKNHKADGLLDIKFGENGEFEIPPFPFNTIINGILRNLIAWEQCDKYNSGQMTSYVLLLDTLINSQTDVKLLRQKGILENLSIDDEMIANRR